MNEQLELPFRVLVVRCSRCGEEIMRVPAEKPSLLHHVCVRCEAMGKVTTP